MHHIHWYRSWKLSPISFTLMIMEFFLFYIDKDIYMLSMIILQTQQLTLQHRNNINQNIRAKSTFHKVKWIHKYFFFLKTVRNKTFNPINFSKQMVVGIMIYCQDHFFFSISLHLYRGQNTKGSGRLPLLGNLA